MPSLPAPMTKCNPARLARELGALFVAFAEALEAQNAAPPIMPCSAAGLTARQVRGLIKAGKLEAVLIGKAWYARPDDIAGLIPRRRHVEQTPLPASPANDEAPPARTLDAADELLERAARNAGVELRPRRTITTKAKPPKKGRAA